MSSVISLKWEEQNRCWSSTAALTASRTLRQSAERWISPYLLWWRCGSRADMRRSSQRLRTCRFDRPCHRTGSPLHTHHRFQDLWEPERHLRHQSRHFPQTCWLRCRTCCRPQLVCARWAHILFYRRFDWSGEAQGVWETWQGWGGPPNPSRRWPLTSPLCQPGLGSSLAGGWASLSPP